MLNYCSKLSPGILWSHVGIQKSNDVAIMVTFENCRNNFLRSSNGRNRRFAIAWAAWHKMIHNTASLKPASMSLE
jgi:hypothetical protein